MNHRDTVAITIGIILILETMPTNDDRTGRNYCNNRSSRGKWENWQRNRAKSWNDFFSFQHLIIFSIRFHANNLKQKQMQHRQSGNRGRRWHRMENEEQRRSHSYQSPLRCETGPPGFLWSHQWRPNPSPPVANSTDEPHLTAVYDTRPRASWTLRCSTLPSPTDTRFTLPSWPTLTHSRPSGWRSMAEIGPLWSHRSPATGDNSDSMEPSTGSTKRKWREPAKVESATVRGSAGTWEHLREEIREAEDQESLGRRSRASDSSPCWISSRAWTSSAEDPESGSWTAAATKRSKAETAGSHRTPSTAFDCGNLWITRSPPAPAISRSLPQLEAQASLAGQSGSKWQTEKKPSLSMTPLSMRKKGKYYNYHFQRLGPT